MTSIGSDHPSVAIKPAATQTASMEPAIIPRPSQMEAGTGAFVFTDRTGLLVQPTSPAAVQAARYLQQVLTASTGLTPAIVESDGGVAPADGTIMLTTHGAADDLGEEGYHLRVTPDGVLLQASSSAGMFYAVQTLLQLLPARVYGSSPPAGRIDWALPAVSITDRPRFRWRGLMLDVCRHFMPKHDLMRYLDCMAMHKLNVFHWHLTDDQGWRIEVPAYPRLMEISAWRSGGDGKLTRPWEPQPQRQGSYGGFYTQQDIREVVAYTAQRHITVVPEIEMPGHSQAALAAYPELSCAGGPFSVSTRTGIHQDVYCAGNEQTFQFLQMVLEEVIPLFPSPYFHIGGDECPKDRWKQCPKCQDRLHREGLRDEHELQSYFIRRIARFLEAHGKRLVGWDEILEGGSASNAVIMSWRGVDGGVTAARAGYEAVMTPKTHCYLDYYQASEGEPQAMGGVVPLETVYSFNPIPPELNQDEARSILGLQGNVWTEFMPDMKHVEYMTWPRGSALAEIGWSGPASPPNVADFLRRIAVNEQRLRARGAAFRPIGRPPSI